MRISSSFVEAGVNSAATVSAFRVTGAFIEVGGNRQVLIPQFRVTGVFLEVAVRAVNNPIPPSSWSVGYIGW